MVNWSDQDKVQHTLWSEHKKIEDHIVPQPKEYNENSFSKFGRYSKKHRREDDYNADSSGSIINQQPNFSSIDMDSWPDLPNLTIAFGGGFNDEIVRDSVVTGLVSEVDDASDMKSVGSFMEGYGQSSVLLHDKDLSPLSKASILLPVNDMQLDGEPDLFGYDDNQNERIVDYDWANIEDFGELDKIFTNNNSVFGNEFIDNAGTFLNADLISSTFNSIPVPDCLISEEQTLEEGSYSYKLGEHSIVKVNPLQKVKTDSANQTLRTKKNAGGKVGYSQGSNNSWNSINQQIPSPPSALNTLQSQSVEQPNSSHQLVFSDYGCPAHLRHGLPFSPQSYAGKNQHNCAHSDFSKHRKVGEATPKPVTMTPQEKIEKLRRRQQMQAMIAIQKQREQYNHQNSGSDVTEHSQKLPSSDASSLSEQDQSQVISSSLDGHSMEEAIYYQLQDVMRKLDMNVRLSIRDSLYRLARSAMERQNVRDGSSSDECNKEEDEASADKESNTDSYPRLPDSEAVTNPIDRIIAHLLFHNPSGSVPMPIADGEISMATSM